MRKKSNAFWIGALTLAGAALISVPAGARPQAGDAEKEAAIKTALDYSDGCYSGDAVRMERAIHMDLNKVYFYRRSPATGLTSIYSTASSLIERTRAASFNLEPEKRLTETAVLEIKDDVACVRVKTAQFCDFVQMIKVNGQWKIINVLWTLGLTTPPEKKVVPDFDAEKERPAAEAAVRDFLEGRLSGDVARLEKALHQETSLVTYLVASKTNVAFVNRARYSGILEPVKAKAGLAPENARKVEVRILDLMDGMAFAVAQMANGTAYLQLQLIDGQWKAINILVRPTNNLTPQPPPPAKK